MSSISSISTSRPALQRSTAEREEAGGSAMEYNKLVTEVETFFAGMDGVTDLWEIWSPLQTILVSIPLSRLLLSS